MKCNEVSGIIEAFREDLLDDHVRSNVLDHLAGCVHCRQSLARLDAVDRQLKEAMGDLAPAKGFSERVSAAARAQEPGLESTSERFPRWIPALAAGLLLVVGVFLAISLMHRRSGSMPTAKRISNGSVEPSSGQTFAIGPAYVVRNGKAEVYPRKASIRVIRIKKGVPELVVDAFPREESI